MGYNMLMNIKKSLKRFYFETMLGYRPLTVVLRHKISPVLQKYLHTHKNFLNLKKYKNWERENINKEIFLEVGFGSGEHLVNLACDNKENTNLKILGVELYTPGAVKVLQKIDENNLGNLYISTDDARDILNIVRGNILTKIFVLFPDPWTKKRQFSRRLVSKSFLNKCLRKLRKNGQIVLATDWHDYAKEIEETLLELKHENNLSVVKLGNDFVCSEEKFKNIVNTNFAKRAKVEGRGITIFIVEKTKRESLLSKILK